MLARDRHWSVYNPMTYGHVPVPMLAWVSCPIRCAISESRPSSLQRSMALLCVASKLMSVANTRFGDTGSNTDGGKAAWMVLTNWVLIFSVLPSPFANARRTASFPPPPPPPPRKKKRKSDSDPAFRGCEKIKRSDAE